MIKTVVASPRNVFKDFVTKNRKQLSGDFDCFKTNYFESIGTDFYMRPITLEDQNLVKLQIWHLSENELFSTIRSRYYKGTHAAVFVFSDLEVDTLTRIEELVKEFPSICGRNKISVSLVYNTRSGAEKRYDEDEIASTGDRLLKDNASDQIVFSKFYIIESGAPWEEQQRKIEEILYNLADIFVNQQIKTT